MFFVRGFDQNPCNIEERTETKTHKVMLNIKNFYKFISKKKYTSYYILHNLYIIANYNLRMRIFLAVNTAHHKQSWLTVQSDGMI